METIYVGNKKPFRNYLMSALIMLAGNKSFAIQARGKAIPKAVSLANVVARRTEVALEPSIGTEELERDGRTNYVSTISIVVKPQ